LSPSLVTSDYFWYIDVLGPICPWCEPPCAPSSWWWI